MKVSWEYYSQLNGKPPTRTPNLGIISRTINENWIQHDTTQAIKLIQKVLQNAV
jgi:hypothetical protein